MAEGGLVGSWKIMETESYMNPGSVEVSSLVGTEFTLTWSGGVTWDKVPLLGDNSCRRPPLLECDTYQKQTLREWHKVFQIRFAAWRGKVVEMRVEQIIQGNMRLSLDNWGMLYCVQTRGEDPKRSDPPFTFLPALEHHLYCDLDLSLPGEQGAHRMFVPESVEQRLRKADPHLTKLVLHYLYSESLPSHLVPATVDRLERLAIASSDDDRMAHLATLCGQWRAAHKAETELTGLVTDMHNLLDQVLRLVGAKIVDDRGRTLVQRNKETGRELFTSPPRLGSAVKQVLKNGLLICLKLAQFCTRFNTLKETMSLEEKEAVVMFVKSRIPIFASQLGQFLKSLRYSTAQIGPADRNDIAAYLLPEIEELGQLATSLGLAAKDLLELVIQKPGEKRGAGCGCDSLPRLPVSCPHLPTVQHLKEVLETKEFNYLRRFNESLGLFFCYLIQEREAFSDQSEGERIRDLGKQIEQLLDEVPLMALHVEKLAHFIQEQMDTASFSFSFTVMASIVTEILSRVKQYRDTMDPIISVVRSLLSQENIDDCLLDLGLLSPPPTVEEPVGAVAVTVPSSSSPCHSVIAGESHVHASSFGAKTEASQFGSEGTVSAGESGYLLNLRSSLCSSPGSLTSRLAVMGLDLFRSKAGTDMVFELRQDTVPPLAYSFYPTTPSAVGDSAHSSSNCQVSEESTTLIAPDETTEKSESSVVTEAAETSMSYVASIAEKEEKKTVLVPAHRVIMSGRCHWFHRALTSGMKEDIERRIVLHDVEEQTFNIFLQYVYSGILDLDMSAVCTQTLADLLLLADRYEMTELVFCCEESLCKKVEEDSVFALMVLGDQFNMPKLRRCCYEYIAERPGICTQDNISELPHNLRSQIAHMTTWVRQEAPSTVLQREKETDFLVGSRHSGLYFSSGGGDFSEEQPLLEDLASNLSLTNQDLEEESVEGSSLEDGGINHNSPTVTDSTRLDHCVVQLREVLGPLVAEEELVQLALESHIQVERALDRWYSNTGQ